MKKILTYLSIAAIFSACELYGPDEDPTTPVYSDGIEITVNSVEDNAATFTLTPKGESTYYSYLLDQSEAAEKLDSSKVLSVSYKSVAQGTVKWSDNKSKSITVNGLQANTSYVIYAVAGSATGIPSAVVTTTFKTSDKVAPTINDAEAEDSEVSLVFSEEVVKASGDITVKYYALNSTEIDEGKPLGSVKGEIKEVNGASATITFEGVPAGAFYSVDVADGAFKDIAGNPSVGIESTLFYDSEKGIVGTNIYGRRTAGSFTIGEADQKLLTDWENDALTADLGSEYGYAGINSKAGATTLSYKIGTKTTTFTLTAKQDFGYSSKAGKIVFYLPEEPERGTQVVVNVPAKTFIDIYGNTNAEWTATALYAFDYTVETVLGTYSVNYSTCFNAMPDIASTDVIVASDNAEKGNIMFTSMFGVELADPVYATFEPQLGTITISGGQQLFGVKDKDGNVLVACIYCGAVSNGSLQPSKNPIVFDMTSADTIENTYYFGILLFNSDGKPVQWYNAFAGYEAVKAASGTKNVPAQTFSLTTPVIPLNQAKIVR